MSNSRFGILIQVEIAIEGRLRGDRWYTIQDTFVVKLSQALVSDPHWDCPGHIAEGEFAEREGEVPTYGTSIATRSTSIEFQGYCCDFAALQIARRHGLEGVAA